MTVSDQIQIVVAIVTAIGVIIALLSAIQSYRSSTHTLSLMVKERSAGYRQAIYSMQMDAYKDAIHLLSQAYIKTALRLRDVQAGNVTYDNSQVAEMHDLHEKIFWASQQWYALLPEEVTKKIKALDKQITLKRIVYLDPNAKPDEFETETLQQAYEDVVKAVREALHIEPLSQETLSVISAIAQQTQKSQTVTNVSKNTHKTSMKSG